MRPFTFLVPFVLIACSLAPQAVDPSLSRIWLLGHWTPVGGHCESDAGIFFRPDGSWFAYEASGGWSLEGNTLAIATTQKWQSGDGIEETLAQPEHHSERVEVTGPHAYRSYQADGEIIEMRRCAPPVD